MNKKFLFSLVLIAQIACASEEKALPKELPAYGPDRLIPVPIIAQRRLPNGLSVWIVKRSGFPKVNVDLVLHGGTAADAAGMEGSTSLLASLLTEGTKTRSARQIAEELQTIGGDLSADAGDDGIYLSGSALRSHLETLLNLTADVTRNPSFPADEVELAKANTLQNLQAQEAQPGFQATRAFDAAIYGAHPYRFVSMTPEVVKAVTPDALIESHARRFRPDQALLVIGGDVENEATFRLVNKAFGDWKSKGAELPITPPAPKDAPRQLLLVERPGSVQTTLRVGRPAIAATNPEALPLAIANVILGGSFNSRITHNLREEKGYTYSPGSSVPRLKAGGNFHVSADVRSEVTGASLNEIFYELDRMGTTNISEEELTSAKHLAAGLYLNQNQLQGAVVSTLAHNWIVGLPPEYLGSYVPKVNAVSAQEVRAVSRKYFAAKDQTVVVVGDKTKIADDLAQFGDFKVYK